VQRHPIHHRELKGVGIIADKAIDGGGEELARAHAQRFEAICIAS
jgi:hypothetical protein